MKNGVNDLRFSDVYTAAGQRSRVESGWSHDDFLVHLRMDALLARTIVVPDTYILDGRYFLDVKPEELRHDIGRELTGRRLPVLVRTRQNTLENSLRRLLVREGSEYLNGFPFNAIENETARNSLTDQLANYPLSKYEDRFRHAEDVPKALVGLLRELLAKAGHEAESDLDRLSSGWTYWIEAERRHDFSRLRTTPWDKPLDVRALVVSPAYQLKEGDTIFTARGGSLYRTILDKVLRGDTYRSDASFLIRHESAMADSPNEEKDILTIRSWYDHMRHRAIAIQHGCTAFAHTLNADAVPVGPLQRRVREIVDEGGASKNEVSVPEDFYQRVAGLKGDEFARIARKVEPSLELWWRGAQTDELRKIVDEILSSSTYAPRPVTQSMIEVLGFLTSVKTGLPGLNSIVSRLSNGLVKAEASQRVVEFLTEKHSASILKRTDR